jgi:hypothetical protein
MFKKVGKKFVMGEVCGITEQIFKIKGNQIVSMYDQQFRVSRINFIKMISQLPSLLRLFERDIKINEILNENGR